MHKYYFIGIKGSGMSGLACILHDLGHDVIGSDKAEYLFAQKELDNRGIKLLPFEKENITGDRIIVRTVAYTSKNNVEVKEALDRGFEVFTYNEMVGKLTEKYKTIAVAGCHGKTSTTSLLSTVMDKDIANYLIGDGRGYASNNNDWFLLEACEYKRHFLLYSPHHVILTNIDLDHIDYFEDIDDVRSAYEEFVNKASGIVVACGDDAEVLKMNINRKILYYGLNDNNDIRAINVSYNNYGTKFDLIIKEKNVGTFDLNLFGKHMLLNSLGVIAICYFEGASKEEIESKLKKYKGAKRRFVEETIGDTVLIDDYAHHPMEVIIDNMKIIMNQFF